MEEIPAVSAPTAEEFPMYANYHNDQLQNEGFVDAEITQLWLVHQCCASAAKTEQNRQRSVGNSLGQLLHRMKALLATPGRMGKWSNWLRERGIPRSTADRLVSGYATAFNLENESPNGAIQPEPTEAEIGRLFAHVWPRCEKVLTTTGALYQFLRCFLFRSGLAYDFNERGILLYEPGFEPQEPEVIASEPQTVTGDGEYGDVL